MKNLSSPAILTSTALRSVAVSLCLFIAGCDMLKDPPTQLEAGLTIEPSGGEVEDKQALAATMVNYLGIEGLRSENVRVAFDKEKKTYFFRVVGRKAISKELLDKVATGLASVSKDRTWPAKLTVTASEDLDTFLKTKEREFPLVLDWKNAEIDAYVVRMPELPMVTLARRMQGGPAEKKTVLCMLSFRPDRSFPKLEGSFSELHGQPEQQGSMAALRRESVFGQMTFSAPHEITFVQPVLAEAFNEPPIAKDGKLMFQFGVIEDAGILDLADSSLSHPIDLGGGTHARCRSELEQKIPVVAKTLSRAALLSRVTTIGPVHVIPFKQAST